MKKSYYRPDQTRYYSLFQGADSALFLTEPISCTEDIILRTSEENRKLVTNPACPYESRLEMLKAASETVCKRDKVLSKGLLYLWIGRILFDNF